MNEIRNCTFIAACWYSISIQFQPYTVQKHMSTLNTKNNMIRRINFFYHVPSFSKNPLHQWHSQFSFQNFLNVVPKMQSISVAGTIKICHIIMTFFTLFTSQVNSINTKVRCFQCTTWKRSKTTGVVEGSLESSPILLILVDFFTHLFILALWLSTKLCRIWWKYLLSSGRNLTFVFW